MKPNISLNTMPGDALISVLDIDGKLLYELQVPGSKPKEIIDLGNHPPGIYCIRVSGEGINESRRLILK